MSEITHKLIDGNYVQIVSARTLRRVLDKDGDDYTRPSDFTDDDEWDVGEIEK